MLFFSAKKSEQKFEKKWKFSIKNFFLMKFEISKSWELFWVLKLTHMVRKDQIKKAHPREDLHSSFGFKGELQRTKTQKVRVPNVSAEKIFRTIVNLRRASLRIYSNFSKYIYMGLRKFTWAYGFILIFLNKFTWA